MLEATQGLLSTTSEFFEELAGGFYPYRLSEDFRTFTFDGAILKELLSVPGWCISNGAAAEKTMAYLGVRSHTHQFTRTILESLTAEVTDPQIAKRGKTTLDEPS